MVPHGCSFLVPTHLSASLPATVPRTKVEFSECGNRKVAAEKNSTCFRVVCAQACLTYLFLRVQVDRATSIRQPTTVFSSPALQSRLGSPGHHCPRLSSLIAVHAPESGYAGRRALCLLLWVDCLRYGLVWAHWVSECETRCGELGTGELSTSGSDCAVDNGVIAAAVSDSCALSPAGEVSCWGPLFDGTISAVPVPVAEITDGRFLAARTGVLCVGDSAGILVCLGDNNVGQLGAPPPGPILTPTRVEGLPSVVDVATSGSHTCAISDAADVWCWGANRRGQLGDGGTVTRFRPALVPLR